MDEHEGMNTPLTITDGLGRVRTVVEAADVAELEIRVRVLEKNGPISGSWNWAQLDTVLQRLSALEAELRGLEKRLARISGLVEVQVVTKR